MRSMPFCQRSNWVYKSSVVDTSAFSPFTFCRGCSCNVFADVFAHSFPVVLPLEEVIHPVDTLVAQFIMCFDYYCEIP